MKQCYPLLIHFCKFKISILANFRISKQANNIRPHKHGRNKPRPNGTQLKFDKSLKYNLDYNSASLDKYNFHFYM